MSSNLEITVIPLERDKLGESPIWDPRENCLYWVDSRGPSVRRYTPGSGAHASWTLPMDVGSVTLSEPGKIVVALEDGFYRLDTDDGALTLVAAVGHAAPMIRMNDGRTDRSGRFVAGSMVLGRKDPEGGLYRLNHDRSVDCLETGLAISNSICFSPRGDRIYYSDSLARKVFTRLYDSESGALGKKEDFIDTGALRSAPDGATIDAEGHMWLALVECGQVARISPGGTVVQTIDLPVPFISCPCFGGPQLDTLYLTSISNSGHRLVSDHPQSGHVFAVNGLGVRGIPDTPCLLQF